MDASYNALLTLSKSKNKNKDKLNMWEERKHIDTHRQANTVCSRTHDYMAVETLIEMHSDPVIEKLGALSENTLFTL